MAAAIRDACRPLTATEVADTMPGATVSNVSAALKDLAKKKGLLDREPAPPRPDKHRGNWPKDRFGLSEKGRSALENVASQLPPTGGESFAQIPTRAVTTLQTFASGIGVLSAGAQLVLVDATDAALPELFHVLADAEPLGAAAWAGLLDGSEQTYLFAYIGEGAPSQALDLVAVLAGARITARRVALTEVSGISELRGDLARRASAARQSRLARDTREAGPGGRGR